MNRLIFLFFVVLFPFVGSAAAQVAGSSKIPRTVNEAVAILKAELSPSAKDWILRNPEDVVVAKLHLPYGTYVRNRFKLWGGNPELLGSCGTSLPEGCSSVIFEALWKAVRQDADPQLVSRLDCEFDLTKLIQVNYDKFYKLQIGQVVKKLQEQIDSELATLVPISPQCGSLSLKLIGRPNLKCWTRAEFSRHSSGPVELEKLLNWLSFRNGFEVLHAPPDIELVFKERCAWPDPPRQF